MSISGDFSVPRQSYLTIAVTLHTRRMRSSLPVYSAFVTPALADNYGVVPVFLRFCGEFMDVEDVNVVVEFEVTVFEFVAPVRHVEGICPKIC
jgi:hypothetical protein